MMLKGKGIFISIVFCFMGLQAVAQQGFRELTEAFYADLNRGDSAALADCFHEEAMLKQVDDTTVWTATVADFLTVAPKFRENTYQESISDIHIVSTQGFLTYVDVTFHFFINGVFSHSGLDHFCWTMRNNQLKIESLYTTNFPIDAHVVQKEKMVDSLMLKWHDDIAHFRGESFFNFMDSSFIYLGTDPGERWTKNAFVAFAQPYIDKKKTWDFKTNWRNWYFSEDGKTAWFEESLATQMEECRGSGVLELTDDGWKIKHYNLTVVIENEKMQDFIKLRRM
jgi:ketosteroid isomerase-like protein